MRVLLHPDAVMDLEAACDWCESQREGLGNVLASEVERAMEAIAEELSMWPRWPGSAGEPVMRRCLLPRFPFAIGYMVEPETVIVLAVAHGRRPPRYWEKNSGSAPPPAEK